MILASAGTTLVGVGMVLVSILLIGLILLQKNRGAGLSGAFGGVGGHSAFGTKTGDMLTWVTVGLAFVFLLLAVVGNYIFVPESPLSAAPPGLPAAPTGGGEQAVPVQPAGTPGTPAPAAPSGPQAGGQLPPGTTVLPIQAPPGGGPVRVQIPPATPGPGQPPSPTPTPTQTPPPAPTQSNNPGAPQAADGGTDTTPAPAPSGNPGTPAGQ